MSASIIFKNLVFYAYHGFLQQERELGQEFRISLKLELERIPKAGDRLEDTVDYRKVVHIVQDIMEGKPRHLLETLAAEIAGRLLHLPGITQVKVKVEKTSPPIKHLHGGVAVEIIRARGE